MQRWGTTVAGTPRFRCGACRITATWRRGDVRERHRRERLVTWLTGVERKAAVAARYGVTRRALSEQFRSLFREQADRRAARESPRIITVDATFIHGNKLCVLVALDEHDCIAWQFAPYERYETWRGFLSGFAPPAVVVADGQKGLQRFVESWWPDTGLQRCHFHFVLLLTAYLTRRPREEAGRLLLTLAYELKEVKTYPARDRWVTLYGLWEGRFRQLLAERTAAGAYRYPKLRSVRLIVRRALPHLFTYLDYPGCPNTTNLVEGWINAAIAERISRHRGLSPSQKRTLVSVVLSRLTRQTSKKPTRKFP